jgi:ABC-type multidrug transport system ATPase subunit
LCDEVIVLDRGRLIAKDSVANLRRMVCKRESLHLVYTPDAQSPSPSLAACPGVESVETRHRNGLVESTLVVADSGATLALLLPALLQANCRLVSIQTQPMTFGDVLLQLIKMAEV